MKRLAIIVLGFFIAFNSPLIAEIITTLQKNDPAPLWSTYFPLDFLLAGRKGYYKGVVRENFPETFSLAISPFYQKASRGRTFQNERVPLSDLEGRWNMLGLLYGGIPAEVSALLGTGVPSPLQLGNAKAAIFSDLPALPNTIIDNRNPNTQRYLLDDVCKRVGYLSVPFRYRKTGLRFELQLQPLFDFGITIRGGVAEIKQTYTKIFNRIPHTDVCCTDVTCTTSRVVRTVECCPIRVDTARIPPEFLESISIIPALQPNDGCSTLATCTPRYAAINEQLMTQENFERIFEEICLDPCNFRDTSVEDTYISVWFRHAFPINIWGNGQADAYGNGRLTNCTACSGNRSDAIYTQDVDTRDPLSYHADYGCGDLCADTSYCYDYSAFLFIPFVSFNVSLPTAKKLDRNKLFALPFGNDGHKGIGMDAGFDFDFYETIEFGMEAGVMYWDCREISSLLNCSENGQCENRWFRGMRLPTQQLQSGVFPFATTVQRKPGTNYHFSIVLSAFRFLCNLSGFAQYVFISHAEDKLFIPNPEVNNPGDIFRVRQAECLSKFESQVFNTGLNYEIGDNFSLGFLVQWPVAQRNAYRSTTYMGSLRMIF
ncbi:MAG: hypothetical protein AB7F19_01490 [Candidatus Babeliales bacterium]